MKRTSLEDVELYSLARPRAIQRLLGRNTTVTTGKMSLTLLVL